MLAVAAGPDAHETTATHNAAAASTRLPVNFTRTSETFRAPRKLPSRPTTSNSPRRSRCGDQLSLASRVGMLW